MFSFPTTIYIYEVWSETLKAGVATAHYELSFLAYVETKACFVIEML